MRKLILAVILTATFSLAQGQKMSNLKQINGQFETDQKTQTVTITFRADVLLEEVWGKSVTIEWPAPQNAGIVSTKIASCKKMEDGKIIATVAVIKEDYELIKKRWSGPVLISL